MSLSKKKKRSPRRITVEWLVENEACPSGTIQFMEYWPKGALLTKANLLKAADADIDIDWLALELLAGHSWTLFSIETQNLHHTMIFHRHDAKWRAANKEYVDILWHHLKKEGIV